MLEGIRNIGRISWIEVFRLIKRKILFQVPELIDFVLLDSKQIKKSWRLSGWGIDSVLHRKRLVDVCQICKGSSECRKREMQRPSEGVFDVKFGKFPHLHREGHQSRASTCAAPPSPHFILCRSNHFLYLYLYLTLLYATLTIYFIPTKACACLTLLHTQLISSSFMGGVWVELMPNNRKWNLPPVFFFCQDKLFLAATVAKEEKKKTIFVTGHSMRT